MDPPKLDEAAEAEFRRKAVALAPKLSDGIDSTVIAVTYQGIASVIKIVATKNRKTIYIPAILSPILRPVTLYG